MSALICGSLAFDTIMVFPDQFKNHILPDKVHILNVSFLVPRMRREFGGCAGNIAYNLHLLGGQPIPMGTVGSDFGPYREYFDGLGIDLSRLALHAPVPLPDDGSSTERHQSRRQLVVELIRRERPTVAQLLRSLSASGHKVLVGTPEQIVDELVTWYQEYAADGFNVLFTHLPGAIDDFVRLITPQLQRRGLFRQRYTGRTLREHLGLARVENRFFRAREPG